MNSSTCFVDYFHRAVHLSADPLFFAIGWALKILDGDIRRAVLQSLSDNALEAARDKRFSARIVTCT